MPLTPSERRLRGVLAVETSWAKTEIGRPALPQLVPHSLTASSIKSTPKANCRPLNGVPCATHARKAHMTNLALKSAKARRERKGRK